MKITKLLATLLSSMFLLSFTTTFYKDDVYVVNTKDSKVEFTGNKKSGYHPGYFPIKNGTVNVANGKIIGGKFEIDIAGIKVTDESGEHLEGTLKSKDFFNAAAFGTAQYDINAVNYKDDNSAEIVGELTVKGIKAEVKFNAIIRDVNDKTLFAQGFFTVDRTKIGLPGFEKDIARDVQIAVHLFATK